MFLVLRLLSKLLKPVFCWDFILIFGFHEFVTFFFTVFKTSFHFTTFGDFSRAKTFEMCLTHLKGIECGVKSEKACNRTKKNYSWSLHGSKGCFRKVKLSIPLPFVCFMFRRRSNWDISIVELVTPGIGLGILGKRSREIFVTRLLS